MRIVRIPDDDLDTQSSLVWSSISRLKPNEKVTSLCLSRKYSNTARIDAEE